MNRTCKIATVFILTTLFSANISFAQTVEVKKKVIAKGSTVLAEGRLVATSSGELGFVWLAKHSAGVGHDLYYQRTNSDLKKMKHKVLIETSDVKDTLVVDLVWTGARLIAMVAKLDGGVGEIMTATFDKSGKSITPNDLGVITKGDFASRLVATPLGRTFAYSKKGTPTHECHLISFDDAGALLADQLLGEIPPGEVSLLPAGPRFLLQISFDLPFLDDQDLLYAFVKPGRKIPKIRSLFRADMLRLLRGQGEYILLYINNGRLYSREYTTGLKKKTPRNTVADKFNDFAVRDLDIAANGDEYAVSFLEQKGGVYKVVFQKLNADGAPTGNRIVLYQRKNLSSPRIIQVKGKYYVSWLENATRKRLMASRITP